MAIAVGFSQDRVLFDELERLGKYAVEFPYYPNDQQEIASGYITERVTAIAKEIFAGEREYTSWKRELHHPSLPLFVALCTVIEDSEASLDKIMDIAMLLLKERKVKSNPYNVAQRFCSGNEFSMNSDIIFVAFNRKGVIDEHEYVMHADVVAGALWNVLRTVSDSDGLIAKAVDVAANYVLKTKSAMQIAAIPPEEKITQVEHVVVSAPPRRSPDEEWDAIEN